MDALRERWCPQFDLTRHEIEQQLTPQCIVGGERKEGFAMKLWRADVQVAECPGALQYRDSIRNGDLPPECHQQISWH
jgi:hypothetical protein